MTETTRPTAELVTVFSRTKVTYNKYLTGREFEYVQAPLLKAMEMSSELSGEMKLGSFDVDKVRESTHRLIEKLVVSVNGTTENALDSVLDLPQSDYEEIITRIQSVKDEEGDKKKLDPSTTTQ